MCGEIMQTELINKNTEKVNTCFLLHKFRSESKVVSVTNTKSNPGHDVLHSRALQTCEPSRESRINGK
jgi:hypothetical protein